ncbi:neprilysin-1-like isoform X2 [Ornithodoros turicata]|uniref:neprilysin-1-like isoform X2 n=1 Tax=Ornithodoros turicata TaxID=34597 RepID=UPI003139577F
METTTTSQDTKKRISRTKDSISRSAASHEQLQSKTSLKDKTAEPADMPRGEKPKLKTKDRASELAASLAYKKPNVDKKPVESAESPHKGPKSKDKSEQRSPSKLKGAASRATAIENESSEDTRLRPGAYIALGAAVVVVVVVLASVGTYLIIKNNVRGSALGMAGPGTTPKWDTGIESCHSNDCRLVKMLLDTYLDKAKDPCQDFYAFVCGEADRRYAATYDFVQGGTLKILENDIATDIVRAMKTHVPERGENVFQKSAAFYQHCLDVKNAKNNNVDGITRFLEQNGIDFTSSMLFDPLEITMKFALQFDIALWFNFSAVRNGTGYDVVVEKRSEIEEQQVIWNSRKTEEDQVEYIGRHVLQNIFRRPFERTYVLETIKYVEFVYGIENSGALGTQKRILLSTLPGADSQLSDHWSRILSRYSDSRLIDVKTYVNIHDRDLMTFREAFAVEANKEAVMRYIAWRTADTLFTVAEKATNGTVKDIEKYCLGLVHAMLPQTVGPSVLFNGITQERVAEVGAMLDGIIAAIDESFTQSKLLDDSSRNVAKQKLSQLKRKIGFHENLGTPLQVEIFYGYLPHLNGSFVDDFIKVETFKTKNYWNHTFQNNVDFVNEIYNIRTPIFVANAEYTVEQNLLTVPPAIMYSPVFTLRGPPDVNYGALGRLLTHYIMRGYDQQGLQFDGTGASSSWFSTQSSQKYRDVVTCVEVLAQSAPGARPLAGDMDELLADVLGSTSLLRAYEAASRDKFWASPNDKLFYVSWCLLWCGRPSNSSHPLRCNLPFMNSGHFQRTFMCLPKSPMNPPKKCTFW